MEKNEPAIKPIKTKDVGLAVVLALFFGALGMLYVRRFLRVLIVSIGLVVTLVVLFTIFQPKNESLTMLVSYLLLGGYHFVVLPVWAYKRAKRLNEEARLSRSKLEDMKC